METISNRVRQLCSWARWPIKLKAGFADERGAAAVFFAVGLVLLAPAALGLVDVYLTTTQRAELQDALDTATLYAARSEEMDDTKLTEIGQKALLSNLKLPAGQKFISSSFTIGEDKITVIGTAEIEAPGIGPELWKRANLQANAEVLRNSNNVEVALVLDTTDSMAREMGNLRAAATDLVGLVIKDQQDEFYTKVALVPYSVGVNMGSYDAAARGGPRGTSAISKATQTRPVVITSENHGLSNGERIFITGVAGMTALNSKEFIVANVDGDTFQLKTTGSNSSNVDGRNYAAYTSGGTITCRAMGCDEQSFTSANGTERRFGYTKCATERLGEHAHDDVGPGTAKVGWHYAGTADNTRCASAEIIPLTNTKKTLTDSIALLEEYGSTAGHIGLAWGWYMISPEWGGVWPEESKPAAYGAAQTLKVVVLMTDGAFNTAYCKGVNAKNSGFGESRDRITCDATNGTAFAQAAELCRNIKDKGVFIYTVGFKIGSDASVKKLMNDCATSPEYVYLPSGGTELKVAFRAIAQDINSLRISK